MLLLAAGIAGGMFVAGCSSKDVRQEAVATVNGDEIKGTELREFLGVPAGVFAVVDIPVERKKEALDQLVAVRLLAQEGRSRGIDNTSEYKEILQRNDQLVRIKALVRKEIEAKLKVTNEEIKAEIAKVKEANKGISDADAAMRAVKSVSGSRIRKIQEDLIAAAKKETLAAVDPIRRWPGSARRGTCPTTSYSPPPGTRRSSTATSRRSSVVCRREGARTDSPTFRKTRCWSETSWSGK